MMVRDNMFKNRIGNVNVEQKIGLRKLLASNAIYLKKKDLNAKLRPNHKKKGRTGSVNVALRIGVKILNVEVVKNQRKKDWINMWIRKKENLESINL